MKTLRRLLPLLVAAAAVRAQEAPRIKLAELVSEALQSNPEILAAQKRYEAARLRPPQQSALPDPMVSAGYTSIGSPRPVAGLGQEPTANAGIMLSQEFPFPGKRRLRGEMAAREADVEFQLYQSVQLDVVARLKQAWYRLWYTWAVGGVLERNRDLLDKLLRITEARYGVGKAPQQDIFKAQTQLTILETRLVKLEQEKHSREAELASLLNRAPGTPLGRPEDPLPRELDLGLEDLLASAGEDSPALRRDQKSIERAELALNLARRDYYPDYTLSAGYFNMGSMPPMYQVRADFKLPLYFFRKQRAALAEQAGSLAGARHEYQSTRQALHFRISDDYLMAQASARLMKLYEKTVVPQATLALESSLAAYETGAADFLSVLSNFTMILDYETNYYEELANFYAALSRLEQSTGRRLAD